MGFFDSLNKVMNVASQIKDIVDDLSSNNTESAANNMNMSTINFSDSSRLVSCSDFADDDNGASVEYNISVMMNDSFKEAKSGACEVSFLYTYAPGKEYGDDELPYFAIQMDDPVYNAVEEFRNSGKISNAYEAMALDGKFICKAKINYGNEIMYLYGIDRCGGYWKNNALCMVYEKAMLGTENEKKIMKIMDEIAASYSEIIVQGN